MKIVEIIRKAEGGMKEHYITLVKGLLNKGHQVTALCDFPQQDLNDLRLEGAQVIPYSFPDTIKPLADIRKIRELENIMSSVQPDILHCHGFKAGLIGRLARRQPGCYVVYSIHNFASYGRGSLGRMMLGCLEKWSYRRTDAVICVSQALRDHMINDMELSPERIHVVYNSKPDWGTGGNGVKIRSQYGIDKNDILIGTAARLIPSKGIHLLLEAGPGVLMQYPNVVFMIAGSGPEETRLRILAEQNGISEHVRFAGHVSNMHDYYSAFDMFILPTMTEGLGITILEAMSFGLPIIATSTGGIPELIKNGENGILVKPNSTHEIQSAILDLLKNPHTAQEYGRQAKIDIQTGFSAEAMVSRINSIFESILGGLSN